MYLLSNEGIKHQFHVSLHFLKLNFLANRGNLLLKLKYVGNVVWLFLKKNHNFSSSVMYILLNKYFCCIVFKKNWLLFWRVAGNTFTFLCVYDMRIWNAFTQNETVKHSWTDSQSSSGDVVCLFMSSLRQHACFSVCVLKENACLYHPFIWSRNNAHQIA